MKHFLTASKLLLSALFRSRAFAEEHREDSGRSFFLQASFSFALALFVLTLCTIASNLLLQLTSGYYAEVVKTSPTLRNHPSSLYFPTAKLYFALVWFLYVVVNGSIRYVALRLFGEERIDFAKSLVQTALATVPLMLSGVFVHILYDIFPPKFDRNVSLAKGQLALAGLSFFASFVWEARIFILISKSWFGQNTGRAFLIWFFPVFVFLVLVFVSIRLVVLGSFRL
ncbi:MAG: hypothetical protein AAF518_22130 [Spirochaetota bacterium]